MKARTELLKWLFFAAIFIAGAIALCVLFGEEAPDVNYSPSQWLAFKGGSMLALYLLWQGFNLCGRLNLLPPLFMDEWRKHSKPGNREEARDE